MKKALIVLALLVLLVSFSAIACHNTTNYCPKTVNETVVWSVKPWLSLSIKNTVTDLGDVFCADSADFSNKNTLWVDGNVAWNLSVSVGGSSIGGHCPNYFLWVSLNPDHGSASTVLCHKKAEVSVDYHLRNLECLPVGDYTALVTYTVTSQ